MIQALHYGESVAMPSNCLVSGWKGEGCAAWQGTKALACGFEGVRCEFWAETSRKALQKSLEVGVEGRHCWHACRDDILSRWESITQTQATHNILLGNAEKVHGLLSRIQGTREKELGLGTGSQADIPRGCSHLPFSSWCQIKSTASILFSLPAIKWWLLLLTISLLHCTKM